jgi:hypothetical protein
MLNGYTLNVYAKLYKKRKNLGIFEDNSKQYKHL